MRGAAETSATSAGLSYIPEKCLSPDPREKPRRPNVFICKRWLQNCLMTEPS